MHDRITFRLTAADRENLTTIATALHTRRPPAASPWTSGVQLSDAVREALRLAAEAVRRTQAAMV
jgi:hypothetical protein